jgi:mannose-6-phosphate isomerase-like protein (cupin superfamily)
MKEFTKFESVRYAVNIAADYSVEIEEHPASFSPQRYAGWTLSVLRMVNDAPHNGEMHPNGDEIIHVLSGKFQVTLDSPEPRVVVVSAGEGIIIGRGTWHKIHILEPCTLVTLVPGPGFESRS